MKESSIPYEKMEVTISPKWVNQAQFAGIYTAIEKGFYKRYGLTVRVKEFGGGSSPLQDIKSGASQFGLMSANEVLSAFEAGDPVKAVATYYQVSPYIIGSLAQKGIRTPSQFRGKVLGIKGGPEAEGASVYQLLLSSASLSPEDVTIKYLPFDGPERDDLLNEKVDVIGFYRTDQLYDFNLENLSYNLIYPEQYGASICNDVLVATPAFLSAHPDATRAFIRATREGWEYAFAHPEEAIDYTLKYVTQESYKKREHERFILQASRPLMQPSSEQKIGIIDTEHWSHSYDVLKQLHFLKKQFDVRDVYTMEYQQ
jgi:ABC-type nitrate/sulfonate/bicarbonate transport system substrate-binding protein